MTTTQQPPKIRLGLDLDGVIYNFVDEFKEYYTDKHGIDPTTLPDPKIWEFYRDWGMTDEQYFIELGTAAINSRVFKNGAPYPLARDKISDLKEMGYEIVIITARYLSNNPEHMKIIEKNTREWLIDNNIPFDELIIDNDKSRHDLSILIDDNILNVESVMMAGQRGYVFDQPWNKEENIYPRVMGWYDLVREMQLIREKFSQEYTKFLSSQNSI